MRSRWPVFALAFGVGISLAACADSNNERAADDTLLSPQFVRSACDLRDLKNAARDWFPNNPEGNDVQALIRDMESACGRPAITDLAWDLLEFVETVFYADRGGDPADGSAVVNGAIDCVADRSCDPYPDIDFSDALSEAGTFAVVGADADAAVAKDPVPFTDAFGGPALAWWGAEPAGGANWSDVLGATPAIIYGHVESDDQLDPEDLSISDVQYTFDVWEDLDFNGQVDVGVCFEYEVLVPPGTSQGVTPRIRREGVVLQAPPGMVPGFCDDTDFELAVQGTSLLGHVRGLLASAVEFLAPTPVLAQFSFDLTQPPGVGGSASDFSTFLAAAAGTDGQIVFLTQPPDRVKPGQAFSLELQGLTTGGTPVEHVLFELFIGNNQGQPAGAYFAERKNGDPITPTAFSEETIILGGQLIYGVADFENLKIFKPGGYYICARAVDTDFDFGIACTNQFHIQK